MNFWEAVLLAIVEGLTEFLPVSSTGHLIIVSTFLDIAGNDFVKFFNVNIQFGAILSVVVLYYKRFFKSLDFYFKLLAGMLPAVVVGLLAGDYIDALLENVWVVSVSLIVGGWVLVKIDDWLPEGSAMPNKEVGFRESFIIGCFQCIAMIPGVSRSAATIIGGLAQKLSRITAAEFSFFLAVPTMFAASAYKLFKDFYKSGSIALSSEEWLLLLTGNVVAFVVAMIAVKTFITYVGRHGFKVFGYYRIVLGGILLILLLLGIDLQMA
ncbi:undecaprenyl-diphosphate phosphatase [Thermonema rossianum]|uniref:undecaprenyl-diphosphate phosphatase n=1 Tax=Thermonema rossianum TaxID=55505 RepID=UPI0005716EFF|nr:undecaprenyl-diphosphate phosphatase [Thermonema rossianum]